MPYRSDFDQHLVNDGFTSNGKLHGTHNMANAQALISSKGGSSTIVPTGTNGVYEMSYSYVKPNGQKVTGTKTVYDPNVYSDTTMVKYARDAGMAGWYNYKADPANLQPVITVNGVKFQVYINTEPVTGNMYIGNVHPIK